MKIQSLFFTFLLILILFLVLLGLRSGKIKEFSSTFFHNNSSKNSMQHSVFSKSDSSIAKTLEKCFKELEITEPNIKRQFTPQDSTVRYEIFVPRGKPIEWIVWYLYSSIKEFNYNILDSEYNIRNNTCQVSFAASSRTKPVLHFKIERSSVFFSETAKMAIIVEDFGFEANKTSVEFLSFPYPLTVSLVSSRKLSVWTAQIAKEYKKELIILLPLESVPRSLSKYKESAIMVHYPQEQIVSLFSKATESVPNFSGFSNLGGNRVMADTRVMEILFSQIKKRNGYFIINPATRKSIAAIMAQKMQIPYGKIDYFIDTEKSSELIIETLRHCILSAHKTGKILIKGKATESFINALNDAVPVFEQNGIKLVYASEIVKQPEKD